MELLVKNRTVLGKKVKTLRREGLIPAEIYGHGIENKHIEVHEKDFRKVFKSAGENTLFDAVTEGGEKIPVLINNIDRNAISGEILSIDFRAVRLDETVETKVPIELKGEAPAVKNGFVVVQVMEEIEVEALPHKLPHKLTVDISSLENPGQSIHISDISFGEEVKILNAPESVIVTVTEKAKEEVVAPVPQASDVVVESKSSEEAEATPAPETPKA